MDLLHDTAARLIATDTVSSRGNAAPMGELGDRLDAAGFRVRLQTWGEGPDAKANFGLIRERHHALVEERLASLGKLEWRPMPNAKESQILLTRQGTPTKKETWPDLNEWMASTLEAMHTLFSPIVKGLNAAEFVAEDVPADAAEGDPPFVQRVE